LIQEGEKIRRAVAGDGAAQALLTIGEFGPASRFSLKLWRSEPLSGERELGVDQTEESIIIGELAIAKWFSRINSSANSSLPRIEALEKANFSSIPAPWLALEWKEPETDIPMLIAYVSEYQQNTKDGWEWAVEELENYLDDKKSLEASTEFATEIAQLISTMHSAFYSSTHRPATAHNVEVWLQEFLATLDLALSSTPGEVGKRLGVFESRIRSWIARLEITNLPDLTLIHGDLHVGQILRSQTGSYSIIDFDGNPVDLNSSALSLEPLAKDLAGMLQSIDHVGRVVAKRRGGEISEEISIWINETQEKLQNSYTFALTKGTEDPFENRDLLLLFQLQQEFREFLYAQNHLPQWMYVPDAALPALIERI
jgi:maltokinase